MAIPVKVDQKVYLAKVRMASQFKGKSKDIDDYIRQIRYTKPKKVRNQIGAIRQSVNVTRKNACMNFFGLFLTNEVGKGQIEQACREADTEMKKIDPTLNVQPMMLKIDLPDLAEGNMFDAMIGQIRRQVVDKALTRVQLVIERNSEGGAIPAKTTAALLRMLEQTRALNIVNDAGVNAQIEQMKARITANEITLLRDELLAVLDEQKDRFSSLELIEPYDAKSEDEGTKAKPPVDTSSKRLDATDLV
jgi:hypothetical protein